MRHISFAALALLALGSIAQAAPDPRYVRGRAQWLAQHYPPATATLFVVVQLALILRLPVPLLLSWCIVAAVGAAPVISFAIMGEYFAPEVSARANGALNTLHFAWAFVAQYATGLVLEQWPQVDGHYPAIAYQTAFGICVAIHSPR